MNYKCTHQISRFKFIKNNTLQSNTHLHMTLIICSTHGIRMTCFLKSLFPSISTKLVKNCSIIKCYTQNNATWLSMIYEGDGTNTWNWTMNDINKYFTTPINISLPNNTELFFIRHGHGQHNNIIERFSLNLTDTMLTQKGFFQAEKAGDFLVRYIDVNYNRPDIFFEASTLRRTMQTIAIIMKKLHMNKPIHITPCINEMYLHKLYLPKMYSHELYLSKMYLHKMYLHKLYLSKMYLHDSIIRDESHLDYIGKNFFTENTPICMNNDNCGTLTQLCVMDSSNTININRKIFTIKWDYFIKFNKNNICDEANIIIQMIECYNFYVSQSPVCTKDNMYNVETHRNINTYHNVDTCHIKRLSFTIKQIILFINYIVLFIIINLKMFIYFLL